MSRPTRPRSRACCAATPPSSSKSSAASPASSPATTCLTCPTTAGDEAHVERGRHDTRRDCQKPVAVSGQEHGRGGGARSLHGFLGLLRRPLLRLQKFRRAQGLPLSVRHVSAANAPLPAAVPPFRT